MALGHRSVAECMASVSSREFTAWRAFDRLEPIGTRTTPDLLALLVATYANVHRRPGARDLLPQDILDDPLQPRRLSRREEAQRTASVMADYRRLRRERLERERSA